MKKHFKIAIQMDPLESINIKSDSTYILSLEAQKRGHSLFHYLPENLIYENGRVSALGNAFKLFPNKKIFFNKSKNSITLNRATALRKAVFEHDLVGAKKNNV